MHFNETLTLEGDLEVTYLQLSDALHVTLTSKANKTPATTEIKTYLT